MHEVDGTRTGFFCCDRVILFWSKNLRICLIKSRSLGPTAQFSRTPPSMINSVPVMLLEPSESRNLAAQATSSDVPNRFKSDFSSNPFSWSGGGPPSSESACQSVPGSAR